MRERELKFIVPEDFSWGEVDLGSDLRLVQQEPLRYDTIYVDTPDLRLAGWGCSLRHRSGEGWTLKLAPSADGMVLDRPELEFRDTAEVPVQALAIVAAYVRGSVVRPAVTLQTVRSPYQLEDGDAHVLGTATVDDVSVRGRGGAQFHEAEFELAEDAPVSLAKHIRKRMKKAGGGKPDPTPKYLRALGARARPNADIVLPQQEQARSLGDLALAAIAGSTLRLLQNDPLVRAGGDDEAVHQARVATRRLRSDLKTFHELVDPAWAADLLAELKWLGGLIGELRDTDVLRRRIQSRVAALPEASREGADRVLRALDARRRRARRALISGMADARYTRLVESMLRASRNPGFDPARSSRRVSAAMVFLTDPVRKLRKAVDRLPARPSDPALHDIRIRAKRARYAAEAIAPGLGKRASSIASAAANLQDVLGEHQDAVVATEWLETRLPRADETEAVLLGRLIRAERAAARASRSQWRAAWDDLDQRLKKADL